MLSESIRDKIYLTFLIIHVPATLLVDVQAAFFSAYISPPSLRAIYEFAAADDPLLSNAQNPLFAWFQSFILLEIFFQLPVFVLGIRGLLSKSPSIYPLLALYGASSATTTWACLATVLTMKGIEKQLPTLLASYVPFFLIPFAMAVDYGVRLTRLARAGEKLVEKKKE